MNELYNLMIRMSLDVGGLSSAAGAALTVFRQLEQHAGLASGAMDQLGRSMSLLAAGAAITGIGLAGVGLMRGWVGAARDVQDAMTGIGLATHQTQTQLDALGVPQMAYRVAGQTQFSAADVLKMGRLAATGGINDPRTLMAMLPTLARVSEIENRLKGTPYEETVPALVAIAHQFQAYGAQPGMNAVQARTANTQFQGLMGRVAQAALVSNLTPTQMERSLAYLTQAHAGLGISPEQALEFTAFASNVGLTGGQGGGARLRAFFQRMAGAPVRPGARTLPLQDQGLAAIERRGGGRFFDAKGTFEGVENAFAVIERASQSYGANQRQRMIDFQQAFGAAGAMVATVGSTPEAQARQRALAQSFAQNPIAFTTQAQGRLNLTLSGQLTTLQTNMQSLASIMGTQLLPPLTAVVHALVLATGAVVQFTSQHPALVRFAAQFTLVTTVVALVVGPIIAAVGAVGLLAVGFAALDVAMAPVLITIGVIALAVAGVTLAIMNWNQTMDLLSGKTSFFDMFSRKVGALGAVGAVFDGILAPIRAVIAAIQLAIAVWDKLHGLVNPTAAVTTVNGQGTHVILPGGQPATRGRIPGAPNPALYGHGAAPVLHIHHTLNITAPSHNQEHFVTLIKRHLDEREREAAARFHDLISFGQAGHGGLGVNLASP